MSDVHTYHVGPWRRWSLWYVFGPAIAGLLILAAGSGWAEGGRMVMTAGIVLLIALPFQFLIDRTRLEFSANGVCLRQTGYVLTAAWSDIVDLRLDRGRQGFVTREPMPGKGAARLARFRGLTVGGAPFYDDEQRQLLAELRFIPIEAFAWHLHRAKMRRDIARLAPHLAHLLPANSS